MAADRAKPAYEDGGWVDEMTARRRAVLETLFAHELAVVVERGGHLGAARAFRVSVTDDYDVAHAVVTHAFSQLSQPGRGLVDERVAGIAVAREDVVAAPGQDTPSGTWCHAPASSAHQRAASLEPQYCIDPKRIFAAGLSNGAMMAYRLGCEVSDLAPVAGAVAVGSCNPSRPVPEDDSAVEATPTMLDSFEAHPMP
jgi:hypothetical protein